MVITILLHLLNLYFGLLVSNSSDRFIHRHVCQVKEVIKVMLILL